MKIKTLSRILFSIIFLFTLSSCAALQNMISPKASFSEVNTVSSAGRIDIKNFFNGDLEGFAITKDQNDKITDVNTIKVEGSWEGNKGVIKKTYFYSTGKKDSRTWLVTVNNDGTFDAVGHDVASPGRGRQIGNVAQMIYSLLVPENGVKSEVRFEDKMYMVDKNSMIMITSFKKAYGSGTNITSLSKVEPAKKKFVVQEKVENTTQNNSDQ